MVSELFHDSLYMPGTPRLLKLLWYYHITKYKNKITPGYFVSEGASGMYWNSPAAGFSVRSRLWVRVSFGSAAERAEARRTETRRGSRGKTLDGPDRCHADRMLLSLMSQLLYYFARHGARVFYCSLSKHNNHLRSF